MISFLMMAKNVSRFIENAVRSLQIEKNVPWELIIVDDGSEDNTYQIAQDLAKDDHRIRVEKNPFSGKVAGTNYAYTLSQGSIIKCIDSDDILLPNFFGFYEELINYDAHCHAAVIVDENLKKMGLYHANPVLISENYEYVASNLISLPKWSWSFSRDIADKVFPLPDELPFEDVWIALLIKKYSDRILNIKEPLYLYRQHGTQTFGGILNYSSQARVFRAKRLIKLISILRTNERVMSNSSLTTASFNDVMEINEILSTEVVSVSSLMRLKLNSAAFLKLLVVAKFPCIASQVVKLKWKLDGIK